jgi:hypothetical protein
MIFRLPFADRNRPLRCERTPEPELQCGSSVPKQATLENGCSSIFSQRGLICASVEWRYAARWIHGDASGFAGLAGAGSMVWNVRSGA